MNEQTNAANADLLLKYKNDVENLRKCAKTLNLSDEEIDKLFDECFSKLNKEQLKESSFVSRLLQFFKVLFMFTTVLLLIFILLYHHQPTLSLVLRNVQGFIYPGLKILRLLALPVIKLFPSLSGTEHFAENTFVYLFDSFRILR